MSRYPHAFSTPLSEPEPPRPVVHKPTAADIQQRYNIDVDVARQYANTPSWTPLHYCHCGKLTHLKATSSVIPVFPIWEENDLCIFHSPDRHTPIVRFQ